MSFIRVINNTINLPRLDEVVLPPNLPPYRIRYFDYLPEPWLTFRPLVTIMHRFIYMLWQIMSFSSRLKRIIALCSIDYGVSSAGHGKIYTVSGKQPVMLIELRCNYSNQWKEIGREVSKASQANCFNQQQSRSTMTSPELATPVELHYWKWYGSCEH